jgi:hypothetical protein
MATILEVKNKRLEHVKGQKYPLLMCPSVYQKVEIKGMAGCERDKRLKAKGVNELPRLLVHNKGTTSPRRPEDAGIE